MSGYTRSPRVQKGAIIGLDPLNPLASVIVFQYNPASMTRSLQPRQGGGNTGGGGAVHGAGDTLRLQGPPTETISIEIEIDATDQLADGDGPATTVGLHPTLAALEMLLYPKTANIVLNATLAAAGLIEVIPPEAPLTLFVWGIQRVVPVRIDSLSITEEAFDPSLNPIRAKAGVRMTVLTYQDLGLLSVGGAMFMAHQVIKEAMGTVNGINSLAAGASVAFEIG